MILTSDLTPSRATTSSDSACLSTHSGGSATLRIVNNSVYPLRSVVLNDEELLSEGEYVPGRLSDEDNSIEVEAPSGA